MPRTPETVSALWQAFYAAAPDPAQTPMTPAPDDLAGWARAQQVIDAPQLPVVEAALRGFAGRVFDAEIGGVPVIEVHPANAKPARGAIVYVHGGAYTLFSASARLMSVLPIVERTGMQVIAVDYTLAPQARWPVALDPWSDIGEVGDSYATLAEADASYRYDRHLANAALAYADHDQHRNPLVSPVYGDFTAGFPPTLIQGGTREIFLSNFVRLYRALVDAKQPAILDLYEGMPHVFQAYPAQAGSPESRAALDATAAFLADHLKRAATKRRT